MVGGPASYRGRRGRGRGGAAVVLVGLLSVAGIVAGWSPPAAQHAYRLDGPATNGVRVRDTGIVRADLTVTPYLDGGATAGGDPSTVAEWLDGDGVAAHPRAWPGESVYVNSLDLGRVTADFGTGSGYTDGWTVETWVKMSNTTTARGATVSVMATNAAAATAPFDAGCAVGVESGRMFVRIFGYEIFPDFNPYLPTPAPPTPVPLDPNATNGTNATNATGTAGTPVIPTPAPTSSIDVDVNADNTTATNSTDGNATLSGNATTSEEVNATATATVTVTLTTPPPEAAVPNTPRLTPGQWHHVVWAFNASDDEPHVVFYIDGRFGGALAVWSHLPAAMTCKWNSQTNRVAMFTRTNGSVADAMDVTGFAFDNLKFYNKLLTDEDVHRLFEEVYRPPSAALVGTQRRGEPLQVSFANTLKFADDLVRVKLAVDARCGMREVPPKADVDTDANARAMSGEAWNQSLYVYPNATNHTTEYDVSATAVWSLPAPPATTDGDNASNATLSNATLTNNSLVGVTDTTIVTEGDFLDNTPDLRTGNVTVVPENISDSVYVCLSWDGGMSFASVSPALTVFETAAVAGYTTTPAGVAVSGAAPLAITFAGVGLSARAATGDEVKLVRLPSDVRPPVRARAAEVQAAMHREICAMAAAVDDAGRVNVTDPATNATLALPVAFHFTDLDGGGLAAEQATITFTPGTSGVFVVCYLSTGDYSIGTAEPWQRPDKDGLVYTGFDTSSSSSGGLLTIYDGGLSGEGGQDIASPWVTFYGVPSTLFTRRGVVWTEGFCQTFDPTLPCAGLEVFYPRLAGWEAALVSLRYHYLTPARAAALPGALHAFFVDAARTDVLSETVEYSCDLCGDGCVLPTTPAPSTAEGGSGTAANETATPAPPPPTRPFCPWSGVTYDGLPTDFAYEGVGMWGGSPAEITIVRPLGTRLLSSTAKLVFGGVPLDLRAAGVRKEAVCEYGAPQMNMSVSSGNSTHRRFTFELDREIFINTPQRVPFPGDDTKQVAVCYQHQGDSRGSVEIPLAAGSIDLKVSVPYNFTLYPNPPFANQSFSVAVTGLAMEPRAGDVDAMYLVRGPSCDFLNTPVPTLPPLPPTPGPPTAPPGTIATPAPPTPVPTPAPPPPAWLVPPISPIVQVRDAFAAPIARRAEFVVPEVVGEGELSVCYFPGGSYSGYDGALSTPHDRIPEGTHRLKTMLKPDTLRFFPYTQLYLPGDGELHPERAFIARLASTTYPAVFAGNPGARCSVRLVVEEYLTSPPEGFVPTLVGTTEVATDATGEQCDFTGLFGMPAGLHARCRLYVTATLGDASTVTVAFTALSASPCVAATTCSGHGECNRDGTCTCVTDTYLSGFWDGDACSECLENYYGAECKQFCNAATTCSGRGACSAAGECVCAPPFAGLRCEACPPGFDAATACATCLPGYHGPECRTYCTSEETCSARGICDAAGTCLCNAGTVGAGCQTAAESSADAAATDSLPAPISTAALVGSADATAGAQFPRADAQCAASAPTVGAVVVDPTGTIVTLIFSASIYPPAAAAAAAVDDADDTNGDGNATVTDGGDADGDGDAPVPLEDLEFYSGNTGCWLYFANAPEGSLCRWAMPDVLEMRGYTVDGAALARGEVLSLTLHRDALVGTETRCRVAAANTTVALAAPDPTTLPAFAVEIRGRKSIGACDGLELTVDTTPPQAIATLRTVTWALSSPTHNAAKLAAHLEAVSTSAVLGSTITIPAVLFTLAGRGRAFTFTAVVQTAWGQAATAVFETYARRAADDAAGTYPGGELLVPAKIRAGSYDDVTVPMAVATGRGGGGCDADGVAALATGDVFRDAFMYNWKIIDAFSRETTRRQLLTDSFFPKRVLQLPAGFLSPLFAPYLVEATAQSRTNPSAVETHRTRIELPPMPLEVALVGGGGQVVSRNPPPETPAPQTPAPGTVPDAAPTVDPAAAAAAAAGAVDNSHVLAVEASCDDPELRFSRVGNVIPRSSTRFLWGCAGPFVAPTVSTPEGLVDNLRGGPQQQQQQTTAPWPQTQVFAPGSVTPGQRCPLFELASLVSRKLEVDTTGIPPGLYLLAAQCTVRWLNSAAPYVREAVAETWVEVRPAAAAAPQAQPAQHRGAEGLQVDPPATAGGDATVDGTAGNGSAAGNDTLVDVVEVVRTYLRVPPPRVALGPGVAMMHPFNEPLIFTPEVRYPSIPWHPALLEGYPGNGADRLINLGPPGVGYKIVERDWTCLNQPHLHSVGYTAFNSSAASAPSTTGDTDGTDANTTTPGAPVDYSSIAVRPDGVVLEASGWYVFAVSYWVEAVVKPDVAHTHNATTGEILVDPAEQDWAPASDVHLPIYVYPAPTVQTAYLQVRATAVRQGSVRVVVGGDGGDVVKALGAVSAVAEGFAATAEVALLYRYYLQREPSVAEVLRAEQNGGGVTADDLAAATRRAATVWTRSATARLTLPYIEEAGLWSVVVEAKDVYGTIVMATAAVPVEPAETGNHTETLAYLTYAMQLDKENHIVALSGVRDYIAFHAHRAAAAAQPPLTYDACLALFPELLLNRASLVERSTAVAAAWQCTADAARYLAAAAAGGRATPTPTNSTAARTTARLQAAGASGATGYRATPSHLRRLLDLIHASVHLQTSVGVYSALEIDNGAVPPLYALASWVAARVADGSAFYEPQEDDPASDFEEDVSGAASGAAGMSPRQTGTRRGLLGYTERESADDDAARSADTLQLNATETTTVVTLTTGGEGNATVTAGGPITAPPGPATPAPPTPVPGPPPPRAVQQELITWLFEVWPAVVHAVTAAAVAGGEVNVFRADNEEDGFLRGLRCATQLRPSWEAAAYARWGDLNASTIRGIPPRALGGAAVQRGSGVVVGDDPTTRALLIANRVGPRLARPVVLGADPTAEVMREAVQRTPKISDIDDTLDFCTMEWGADMFAWSSSSLKPPGTPTTTVVLKPTHTLSKIRGENIAVRVLLRDLNASGLPGSGLPTHPEYRTLLTCGYWDASLGDWANDGCVLSQATPGGARPFPVFNGVYVNDTALVADGYADAATFTAATMFLCECQDVPEFPAHISLLEGTSLTAAPTPQPTHPPTPVPYVLPPPARSIVGLAVFALAFVLPWAGVLVACAIAGMGADVGNFRKRPRTIHNTWARWKARGVSRGVLMSRQLSDVVEYLVTRQPVVTYDTARATQRYLSRAVHVDAYLWSRLLWRGGAAHPQLPPSSLRYTNMRYIERVAIAAGCALTFPFIAAVAIGANDPRRAGDAVPAIVTTVLVGSLIVAVLGRVLQHLPSGVRVEERADASAASPTGTPRARQAKRGTRAFSAAGGDDAGSRQSSTGLSQSPFDDAALSDRGSSANYSPMSTPVKKRSAVSFPGEATGFGAFCADDSGSYTGGKERGASMTGGGDGHRGSRRMLRAMSSYNAFKAGSTGPGDNVAEHDVLLLDQKELEMVFFEEVNDARLHTAMGLAFVKLLTPRGLFGRLPPDEVVPPYDFFTLKFSEAKESVRKLFVSTFSSLTLREARMLLKRRFYQGQGDGSSANGDPHTATASSMYHTALKALNDGVRKARKQFGSGGANRSARKSSGGAGRSGGGVHDAVPQRVAAELFELIWAREARSPLLAVAREACYLHRFRLGAALFQFALLVDNPDLYAVLNHRAPPSTIREMVAAVLDNPYSVGMLFVKAVCEDPKFLNAQTQQVRNLFANDVDRPSVEELTAILMLDARVGYRGFTNAGGAPYRSRTEEEQLRKLEAANAKHPDRKKPPLSTPPKIDPGVCGDHVARMVADGDVLEAAHLLRHIDVVAAEFRVPLVPQFAPWSAEALDEPASEEGAQDDGSATGATDKSWRDGPQSAAAAAVAAAKATVTQLPPPILRPASAAAMLQTPRSQPASTVRILEDIDDHERDIDPLEDDNEEEADGDPDMTEEVRPGRRRKRPERTYVVQEGRYVIRTFQDGFWVREQRNAGGMNLCTVAVDLDEYGAFYDGSGSSSGSSDDEDAAAEPVENVDLSGLRADSPDARIGRGLRISFVAPAAAGGSPQQGRRARAGGAASPPGSARSGRSAGGGGLAAGGASYLRDKDADRIAVGDGYKRCKVGWTGGEDAKIRTVPEGERDRVTRSAQSEREPSRVGGDGGKQRGDAHDTAATEPILPPIEFGRLLLLSVLPADHKQRRAMAVRLLLQERALIDAVLDGEKHGTVAKVGTSAPAPPVDVLAGSRNEWLVYYLNLRYQELRGGVFAVPGEGPQSEHVYSAHASPFFSLAQRSASAGVRYGSGSKANPFLGVDIALQNAKQGDTVVMLAGVYTRFAVPLALAPEIEDNNAYAVEFRPDDDDLRSTPFPVTVSGECAGGAGSGSTADTAVVVQHSTNVIFRGLLFTHARVGVDSSHATSVRVVRCENATPDTALTDVQQRAIKDNPVVIHGELCEEEAGGRAGPARGRTLRQAAAGSHGPPISHEAPSAPPRMHPETQRKLGLLLMAAWLVLIVAITCLLLLDFSGETAELWVFAAVVGTAADVLVVQPVVAGVLVVVFYGARQQAHFADLFPAPPRETLQKYSPTLYRPAVPPMCGTLGLDGELHLSSSGSEATTIEDHDHQEGAPATPLGIAVADDDDNGGGGNALFPSPGDVLTPSQIFGGLEGDGDGDGDAAVPPAAVPSGGGQPESPFAKALRARGVEEPLEGDGGVFIPPAADEEGAGKDTRDEHEHEHEHDDSAPADGGMALPVMPSAEEERMPVGTGDGGSGGGDHDAVAEPPAADGDTDAAADRPPTPAETGADAAQPEAPGAADDTGVVVGDANDGARDGDGDGDGAGGEVDAPIAGDVAGERTPTAGDEDAPPGADLDAEGNGAHGATNASDREAPDGTGPADADDTNDAPTTGAEGADADPGPPVEVHAAAVDADHPEGDHGRAQTPPTPEASAPASTAREQGNADGDDAPAPAADAEEIGDEPTTPAAEASRPATPSSSAEGEQRPDADRPASRGREGSTTDGAGGDAVADVPASTADGGQERPRTPEAHGADDEDGDGDGGRGSKESNGNQPPHSAPPGDAPTPPPPPPTHAVADAGEDASASPVAPTPPPPPPGLRKGDRVMAVGRDGDGVGIVKRAVAADDADADPRYMVEFPAAGLLETLPRGALEFVEHATSPQVASPEPPGGDFQQPDLLTPATDALDVPAPPPMGDADADVVPGRPSSGGGVAEEGGADPSGSAGDAAGSVGFQQPDLLTPATDTLDGASAGAPTVPPMTLTRSPKDDGTLSLQTPREEEGADHSPVATEEVKTPRTPGTPESAAGTGEQGDA